MGGNRSYSAAVTLVLTAIVVCAFAGGPSRQTPHGRRTAAEAAMPEYPDSLRTMHLYTEGLKRLVIDADTAAAGRFAQQALERDSDYAPALHLLSRTLAGRDRAGALEYARRAYGRDTTNQAYLDQLSQQLIDAGLYAEAAQYYERITGMEDNPYYYRLLAMLYGQTGRLDDAVKLLDSAEGRFGRQPVIVGFRHRVYLVSKRFGDAEREAQQMVADTPYLPESYIALADTYAITGRDSLAEQNYLRATALDPSNAEAWSALGDIYRRRKDFRSYLNAEGHLFDSPDVELDYKMRTFDKLLSDRNFYRDHFPQMDALAGKIFTRHIDRSEACEFYARYMFRTGRRDVGLRVWHQMLDADPSPDKFGAVAELEMYFGSADSAAKVVARGLERYPDNLALTAQQGDIYMHGKDYDNAIATYRHALALAPSDSVRSWAWGAIGTAENSRSDSKACYKAYDKSLRYNRDNAMVLNNYAYFLSLTGERLERALTMARRATELSSGNSTYLDTLAWVLYRLGRFDEAKRTMQQALSLDHNSSPELALHYGDILDALGETFMARTYWRKALELGHADTEGIARRIESGTGVKPAAKGGRSKKKQQ